MRLRHRKSEILSRVMFRIDHAHQAVACVIANCQSCTLCVSRDF